MNNLKWMGHTATMLEIQRTLRNELKSCDVHISGGGKIFQAHRFVLSSASDMLRDVLNDYPPYKEPTIIIPETKDYILHSILSFIYYGEVQLNSAHLSEFLETTNLLGIKSAISFECGPSPIKHIKTVIEHHPEAVEAADVEEDVVMDDKEHEEDTTVAEPQRDFEYLDVYPEPEKISYTIEHIEQCQGSNSGEYILTEAGGTFTLTAHNQPKSTDSSSLMEKHPDIEMHQMDPSTNINQDIKKPIKIKTIKKIKTEIMDPMPSTSSEEIDSKQFPKLNEARYEALEGAVDSVVHAGMSLQKAAAKYNISKTVLWRRVKKHPQYLKNGKENPLFEAAFEKLKAGESLKNISLALDIPMSTLHRHKVKLSMEGRLPEHLCFKKRGLFSKEVLKEKLSLAVEACLNGMSQNHAANVYEVPKSTLWRHLQKVERLEEPQDFIKVENEDAAYSNTSYPTIIPFNA